MMSFECPNPRAGGNDRAKALDIDNELGLAMRAPTFGRRAKRCIGKGTVMEGMSKSPLSHTVCTSAPGILVRFVNNLWSNAKYNHGKTYCVDAGPRELHLPYFAIPSLVESLY
jgi:hypothetical protein